MTPPLKRFVHMVKVRPRLFIVMAIGVLTGLFLPQGVASQPISRWLVAWNVGAWLYVAMAAAWGAAFGFMAYMTYDLTNMATLRDWPLALSFIDVAWGCVATGLAATTGKLVADRVQ